MGWGVKGWFWVVSMGGGGGVKGDVGVHGVLVVHGVVGAKGLVVWGC